MKRDGKNVTAFQTWVDVAFGVSVKEKGGFIKTSFNQGIQSRNCHLAALIQPLKELIRYRH